MIKHGFIENIEDDNVYVVFDDGTSKLYHKTDFPIPIKLDMVVEDDGGRISVKESPEDLKAAIKDVTDAIFVPFKKRSK